MLELNFFRINFPGPLSYHVRHLDPHEGLLPGERLWKPLEPDDRAPRRAVFVGLPPVPERYSEELHLHTRVPVGIVKQCLEWWLHETLVKKSLYVVRRRLSIECFDPLDKRLYDGGPYLSLVRGVEFHVDRLRSSDEVMFGCFVSSVVRWEFTNGLMDPVCRALAIGRRVEVKGDAGLKSATLLQVTNDVAEVEFRENGCTRAVPISDVIVPAAKHMLEIYCTQTQRDYRRVIRDQQVASYRLSPSGGRNSGWLHDRFNHVCSWLDARSSYGRFPISWPGVGQDPPFMVTQPLRLDGVRH